MLAACASNDAGDAVGGLELPLTSTSAGERYALAATFELVGPESLTLRTEPTDSAFITQETLAATPRVGHYTLSLTDHQLYRVQPDATPALVAVEGAVLTSAATQSIEIVRGQTTSVVYQFHVPGVGTVVFARGALQIRFEVVERSAVGAPCTEVNDCALLGPSAVCFTEADSGVPAGFCSAACDGSPGQCPGDAQCVESLCLRLCGPGIACQQGEACVDAGVAQYCVPVCNVDAQCSDGRSCDVASGTCVGLTCAANDATCDGLDDDCDGAIDEDYPLSFGGDVTCGASSCLEVASLVCESGIVTDTCEPPSMSCVQESACDDGLDDDGDGWIDCADPDCEQLAACLASASPLAGTCSLDGDCRAVLGAELCLAAPGGYCSRFCDQMDPSTCPDNGVCSGGICMLRCNPRHGASACTRVDHICILEAGNYVCLPPP